MSFVKPEHYAAVRELLAEEDTTLTELLPGVTVHGMDVGKWLARQREHAVWQALLPQQRERLEQLGITALAAPKDAPAKARGGAGSAFERGVEALRQYRLQEGHLTVPRIHVETLPDGTQVKLGVFLSNTKTRRAKLTEERRKILAGLGLDWATGTGRAVGIMRAMDDARDVLTEDEINDLLDGDRDAGWDADDEYEWVR